MEELSAFKNAPARLHALESRLLERADVVFTGGPSLYEDKRARHANVHCLPSAVDAHHYSRRRALADEDAVQRAAHLHAGIGRPRLGFFGVIDERLDLGLVRELATSHAPWQLVMVGPVVKISADELPRLDNIHWLGQQPYGLLAQLVATWDVCLLPFALNESTQFMCASRAPGNLSSTPAAQRWRRRRKRLGGATRRCWKRLRTTRGTPPCWRCAEHSKQPCRPGVHHRQRTDAVGAGAQNLQQALWPQSLQYRKQQ